jgi:parallel beta-helix repeat protein
MADHADSLGTMDDSRRQPRDPGSGRPGRFRGVLRRVLVVAAASAMIGLGVTLWVASGAPAGGSNASRAEAARALPPVVDAAATMPIATVARCVGTAMTAGQADIDRHPPGTKFCLSGTHNWTLDPKSDDQLFGPAVLNGANSTQYAVLSTGATHVVLVNLEVENYRVTDQEGAIQGGSGWVLKDVRSHDNGTVGATGVAGGYGAGLGFAERVIGGRYYNNRQGGLQGGGATNAVINGAEIDHNNFTDDSYTRQNIDCNYEAGGMKWVAKHVTVENSKIHDNACRGLWTDIGSSGTVIENNQIYRNWDEGIFIEISGSTTIAGNTITNNGFRTQVTQLASSSPNVDRGCSGYLGAGIMIGTSGQTHTSSGMINIEGNHVQSNCNAVTAFEDVRTDTQLNVCGTIAPLCQLRHLRIHGNRIEGSSAGGAINDVGYFEDDGTNLRTHDIVFGPGNVLTGVHNCQFTCHW